MSKSPQPKGIEQGQLPITRGDVLRLINVLENIEATLDDIAGTNSQIEAYLDEMHQNKIVRGLT